LRCRAHLRLQLPLPLALIPFCRMRSHWICIGRAGFWIRDGGRQDLKTTDVSGSARNAGCEAASVKCILVTGSLGECLRVVRPESQGGQMLECTGPMRWPSGASERTWVHRRQAWEPRRQVWAHVESQYSSLGKHLLSVHCWCACKSKLLLIVQ
jgi:hypothetical protein